MERGALPTSIVVPGAFALMWMAVSVNNLTDKFIATLRAVPFAPGQMPFCFYLCFLLSIFIFCHRKNAFLEKDSFVRTVDEAKANFTQA